MKDKILCVDDDQNILLAYQRQLRKQFQIDTALGGAEGLQALENDGPFAVVVSDLRMPGMNGIEFLTKVKERSPDTVRIMLTGNADTRAAIEAVNEGNIFRFLTKPCLPQDLAQTLQAGIDRYRLISAERDLLQNTLNGSIRVLTEILSIVDPQSFGRARMLRESMRILSGALKIADSWELELAAMLSQIGHVTVPPEIIIKEKSGQPLSDIEKEILSNIPQIGHTLLAHIPRLESVARIVLYQNKRFDGSGFPKDTVGGARIPLGARMLKVLTDLAQVETEGIARAKALEVQRKREGWYDPAILDAAFLCFASPPKLKQAVERSVHSMALKDLKVGQILLSDVVTCNGALLITAGNWVSETMLERIKNFAKLKGVKEPIQVEVIRDAESDSDVRASREAKL
ncbi:MAG: response regulator [Acidobacteriia bacterium]|nr:response regulator [Terriglobia bacterium]